MKIINVVIVTFNRKEFLVKTLNSVYSQSYKINKLFCIDNNSSDGTLEKLKNEGFLDRTGFIYINTGENLGGAGGFKFGLTKAIEKHCDYIWLMDDDIEADKNCLSNLVEKNEIINGVTQPVRYYSDGEFFSYDYKKFNFKNPFKEFKVERIKNTDVIKNKFNEICAVPFEGPLISRNVVDKIGEIDDGYFIMADDTDYSIRAKKEGFKIYLVSDAILTRLIKPKEKKDFNWKVYFYYRNITMIDIKYASFIVVYIRSIVRVIRYMLTVIRGRKTFRNFKSVIFGIHSGLTKNKSNELDLIKKKYGE